jgi:hypothetical protein
MLSNIDIERLAEKLDLPIIGVFSKDDLPKNREVGSYYINMQNKDDGDGTHWVLAKIYCDEEREENKVRFGKDLVCNALYFDPFGIDMPKEVKEFLKPFAPIPWNNRQIQSINTTQCGWYCLYCDYYLENESDSKELVVDYSKFLNSWQKNPIENLKLLKKRFKPL